MTKHLSLLMIKRHLDSLFLEFKEGGSDKAAKLQSVTRLARQELAASKLMNVDGSFASVSGEAYWAERGESGRWVRVHTHPRTSTFLPWKVPGGPGRKTRLTQERSTRGVDVQGKQFKIDDIWNKPRISTSLMIPWTGRILFLVDKIHTNRWGTDQRRQRVEASNLINSQSGTSSICSMKKLTRQSIVGLR